MSDRKIPLIGGHVSVAGGLFKAIENAEQIGANCIQIFGASPRQWQTRLPSDEEIKKYRERLRDSEVKKVYLHAAYLVNFASSDEGLRKKSIKSLIDHLKIASIIDSQGLIFHIGSGKELPKEKALAKVVEAIRLVLKSAPGADLIIENTAGGGQKIGSNAEEIGRVIKEVSSPRLKVCFDTAHAYEAGIIDGYTKDNIKKLLNEWNEKVGLDKIIALHVNDSKTKFNSHHDRHENIGEGYIGLEGFKNLAKEKRLYDKAWILEVPGFDGNGPDKKNIDILRNCFSVK